MLPLQGVGSLINISSFWFNDVFVVFFIIIALFLLQEGALRIKIWTQK